MDPTFSYEIKSHAFGTILYLHGIMDETARLPDITSKNKIIVVMNDLSSITSSGIIYWIKWLQSHSHVTAISLRNCRPMLVKAFNNVRKVLPSNSVVESFYVTYRNEKADEDIQVLYQLGKEFDENGLTNPPSEVERNGVVFGLDVDTQAYFQFLRRS